MKANCSMAAIVGMGLSVSSCSLLDIRNAGQQDWITGAVPAVTGERGQSVTPKGSLKTVPQKGKAHDNRKDLTGRAPATADNATTARRSPAKRSRPTLHQLRLFPPIAYLPPCLTSPSTTMAKPRRGRPVAPVKGWKWAQIWQRMAELGRVDKEDAAAFLSFRS